MFLNALMTPTRSQRMQYIIEAPLSARGRRILIPQCTSHHDDHAHQDLEKWNPNASHAWFAGWAPAEDPELVIIVLVEHGGAGGTNAWPIAQRILDGYFTKIRDKKLPAIETPKVKSPSKKAAQ